MVKCRWQHLLVCIQSLPSSTKYECLASMTKNAIGLILDLMVTSTISTPITVDAPPVKLVICMLFIIKSDIVLPNFLSVATGITFRIAPPSMNTQLIGLPSNHALIYKGLR